VQQQGKGVRYWVLGSAALMVVGAFGPWVKALGIFSVGGTDGSNDGWLVVAAAVIGGVLFYATRRDRGSGLWVLLAGIAGVAVTLYDRSHVQNAIDRGGVFAQAIVQVGWGLNLALIASISLGIVGIVRLAQASAEPSSEVRPLPFAISPAPRASTEAPSITPPPVPPSVPTPPPD
jgi:hypothetical protein